MPPHEGNLKDDLLTKKESVKETTIGKAAEQI
jgi:hypothetical protein